MEYMRMIDTMRNVPTCTWKTKMPWIMLAIVLFLPLQSAHAFFLDYSSRSEPLFLLISNSGDPGSYDADTGVFSSTMHSFGADITGDLRLTANIDANGGLLGGQATWIGGSEFLGITGNSMLLDGVISDFAYGLDANSGFVGFEFKLDIYENLLGFTEQAGLMLFNAPFLYDQNGELLDSNSWFRQSFSLMDNYTHDDLFGLTYIVNEPGTLFLVALVLAGWVVTRRFV